MTTPLIEMAKDVSIYCHEGQRRRYSGEPHHWHCFRVADAVAESGASEVLVAAAYLHDALEDAPDRYWSRVEFLPGGVQKLVVELTHQFVPPAYRTFSRPQRKYLEALRVAATSREARLIKAFDVLDNTSGLAQNDPAFAKQWRREVALYLPSLPDPWQGMIATLHARLDAECDAHLDDRKSLGPQ